MHIVNKMSYAMMKFILKTISSVNSADYYYNKFLSASAWSILSTLIISAETSG